MKTLVILGTSREESNTLSAITQLCPFSDYELIDLQTIKLNHYDYDRQTDVADDFQMIAQKMLVADNIIFATPVYWYAMSGRLKMFFDRLTELLFNHKAIGKGLKGKKTYLIATGSDPELPEGFEVPFRKTSEYFEMHYEQAFYLAAK
jgi:multimeric flavodoxin WrbA